MDQELNDFLNHIINIHCSVQFTMETGSNGHLPFLEYYICTRQMAPCRHTVYGNPNCTNLYLNAESHDHPANKHSVLSTLVHQARAICDQEISQDN